HTYLKRIYSKLGVHSRVELVARMMGTVGTVMMHGVEQDEHDHDHDHDQDDPEDDLDLSPHDLVDEELSVATA
ncbi:MAG TPA: hypothetical protein VGI70_12925, partial [Polyangiales bacterium]